jgi:glyoxylase-like metal-dependent hydrolase (beta-lactamase superfamily II)
MLKRLLPVLCLALSSLAAWLGTAGQEKPAPWQQVAPGVFRSPSSPAGHALIEGTAALLIDAPHDPAGLAGNGVQKIDGVLLTHHHWDTCEHAGKLLALKVPVRAPQKAAEWLTPEQVRKHWSESIPLRHSRAAYLVHPTGLEGIDCSLADGQKIDWHGWTIQVVATPGHSRDHLAFAARKGKDGPLILFAGDAIAAPGKLWTPYTTDWNHWTDEGLTPAAESLRKLAALKPAVVLPAHGPAITDKPEQVLLRSADAVADVAFLKSFERYTKQRLGNAPEYAFLAKEQVASGGQLPWSQLSTHLFITGNTYVLTSKDGPFMVIDPWGKLSAEQIGRLKSDRKLGPLEVVMFSHAHFDHYDGIYHLADRDRFQVWTLDRVATPIAEPFRYRAPFLDARPVKIDRLMKDGETAAWREYRFRFQHFPGQSEFTMGVQVAIDGRKCFFTADNFFHQDQFSGTGGWMGLNRSWPLPYAASAQKVLDAAPDWVLAEHGGPFEFNAIDFQRRVRWGQACASAADAVSPSGNHRRDWNPHQVQVEPLVHKVKPGGTIQAVLAASNALGRPVKLTVALLGRDVVADQRWTIDVAAGASTQVPFTIQVPGQLAEARHVFLLRVVEDGIYQAPDAVLIADVEK